MINVEYCWILVSLYDYIHLQAYRETDDIQEVTTTTSCHDNYSRCESQPLTFRETKGVRTMILKIHDTTKKTKRTYSSYRGSISHFFCKGFGSCLFPVSLGESEKIASVMRSPSARSNSKYALI